MTAGIRKRYRIQKSYVCGENFHAGCPIIVAIADPRINNGKTVHFDCQCECHEAAP